MAYLEFFPEEYIQLNREITYHPALQALLAKHPEQEFELKLAEVAAYCFIEVDGEFTQEELRKLATLCIARLQQLQGVRPLDQEPRVQVPDEDWSKLAMPSAKKH